MHPTTRLAALVAAVVLGASPAGAKVVFNTIGGTAALLGQGHAVHGTVLIGCTGGEQIQITLTLTQDGVSGTGSAAGICTGELAEYEVTVTAGGDAFTAGVAAACATAENYRRGVLVESRQWCRAAGVALN